MFKKKCKCGETEKSFKRDIGPFFISECCENNGYDFKGNKVGGSEDSVEVSPQSEVALQETEKDEKEVSDAEELMKLTAKQLKAMAEEKDVKDFKKMTKKQLIAALLG